MPSVAQSADFPPNETDLPPPPRRETLAARDIVEGLKKSWLWTTMALQDIRLRYRGSILGPMWLTVSTVAMISGMGVVYAKLFHTDIATYLPFLTIGLVTWGFIFTVITEGCGTFVAAGVIQQLQLPFSLHAYRLVCRNLLVLAHTSVVVPIVLLLFGKPVDWHILLVVPALAVLTINGVWISMLFGMTGARFRDVGPIVASFLQVIFFVTPIFWSPDSLGIYGWIVVLNPLFSAVDIVRSPLLGITPSPYSWTIILLVTVFGSAVTFAIFARFRARIAFWV